MRGKKLSEIISENLGTPFLDAILEHNSEHNKEQLDKRYVEEKKMKEPIPQFNMNGAFACYNPISDEIYYDKDLDNYPTTRDKILKHEQLHREHRFNVPYHIYRDMIDYPFVFASEEFHDYYFSIDTKNKISKKKLILGYMIYMIFQQIFMVVSWMIILLGGIIYLIKGLFKRK